MYVCMYICMYVYMCVKVNRVAGCFLTLLANRLNYGTVAISTCRYDKDLPGYIICMYMTLKGFCLVKLFDNDNY